MGEFDSIFGGVGVQPARTNENANEYRPSYKNGDNGKYSSLVRFVPYVMNPSKNVMQKMVAFVKDPASGKGRYIDDPRSIGEPSPISEMFGALWNTGIESYKNFAKNHLSASMKYAALVQIIDDKKHPELNGQIKVFVFGKTVYEKLQNEQYPEENSYTQSSNPFHPFYGRVFNIVCKNKGGFNNMEDSAFIDYKSKDGRTLSSAILMQDMNTKQYVPVPDTTDQSLVIEFLKANSPDLSKYDYQPMSEDSARLMREVLQRVAYNMENQLIGVSTTSAFAAQQSPSGFVTNSAPSFPGASAPTATPQFAPTPQTAPVQTPAPSVAPQFAPTPQTRPESVVSGVEVPDVRPQVVSPTESAPSAVSAFGNLDSIVANL